MPKFNSSSSNGVIAVISHKHAKKAALITGAGGDLLKADVKIFTFCSEERLAKNPELKKFFTGTVKTLEVLLSKEGNEMDGSDLHGWSGFVPFSNGRFEEESGYITTLDDAMEVFGL